MRSLARFALSAACFVMLTLLTWPSAARACDPGVEVLITEFMASNASGVTDEDGEYSDWIELYAPCGAGVNLDGWYLTDDPTNLTKWRFPAVQLARGEFLVVFASGKNRGVLGSELHTSFKLSQDGEYLALVRPDGTTVAQAFTPGYPAQFPDVSYGVPQSALALIPAGATARYRVPVSADAPLGTTWTESAFDDSAWSTGPTGFGYTAGTTDGFEVTYFKARVSVSDLSTAEAVIADPALRSSVVNQVATKINYLNTGGSAHFAGDLPFPSTQIGVDVNDFVVEATGTVVIPSAGPWTFGVNSDDGFSLELSRAPSVFTMSYPSPRGPGDTFAVFNVPEPGAYQLRLVFYERGGGSELELFAAAGSLSGFSSAFRLVGDTTGGGLQMSSIGSLIGTDVRAAVWNVNTSLWSRVAFNVSDPTFLEQMVLKTAYEDGFVAYLNGTEVARSNAPASLSWDAAAAADRPVEDASTLVSFDLSSSVNLLQAGTNVLAVQALNEAVGDPDFLILPVLDAAEATVDSGSRVFFDVPTPGGYNAAGYAGVSGAPAFSHPNSFFTDPFTLSLSAAAPGAVIRYTLDGSQPTATHGTEYLGPLSVTDSTRIRARVFVAGLAPGPVLTRLYAKIGADIAGFTSNLPLVLVHTFGGGLTQNFLTENLVGIIPTTGGRAAIVAAPQFTGRAGIKIRGSSSTSFPKKQYALELWDEYGRDIDGTFLGLPAESDWILYGPYTDKTLMRDVLTYDWSNAIGRYASRTRFVETYLRASAGPVSAGDYVGVYAIIEKIKAGPARVNITPLLPEDGAPPQVTGGYILKKDRLDPGDSGLLTSRGQRLAYVEPKENEITGAQAAYIKGYLDQFEAALYGPSFTDPVTGYAAYIDVDAFIDHHWLVEMTKNIDGFRLSTYMFKDRLAKLQMGPAWDYNLSLGNANYLEGWLATGWYAPQLGDSDYPYWRRLFEDPEFTLRYWDRWYALRRGPWRTDTLQASIDAYAQTLAEAEVRNYVRWPILGTYVWPNWYIGATYQDEVTWMKAWLTDRLNWIDAQYVQPPTLTPPAGPVVKWTGVTMSAASGTIYYTLDGTDPRLPGGGMAPGAIAYSGPVAIGVPTTVKARTFSGSIWSALNEAAYDPRALAFLNEIIADNATVIADEHGDFDPWIELYNPSTQTASLAGMYLTDDLLAPTKWAFPANTTVCGQSRLLVWADGEPSEGGLHASFRPGVSGGTVWLLDGQARVMDVLSYPALARNVSYGRVPDGGSTLASFSYATPGTANSSVATRILVNEYNAVAVSKFLAGTDSDTYWGRVLGNGGDWFELVVIQDHLDLRGWRVDVQDSGGPTNVTLTFTNAALLSDLRSGTIITVAESLPSNVSYDPAGGDWWIHLRAGNSGDGIYISATDFETSQNSTRLTVRDASSNVAFGPAGEGIQPASGVGNDEVFKLEANPSSSITSFSNYHDGTSSTFGSPNRWAGGTIAQDFSVLRSVVAQPCTTDPQCNDANPCTDDACVAGTCQNAPNTAPCDDANPCTANDACDERQCRGQAVAGCCFSDCACDDANACTTDRCEANACTHAPVAAGTPCNDGIFCTVSDTCGGSQCAGVPRDCADTVACTDDSCLETGCVHTDNAADCNDNNACTDDACDPGTGCVHTINTATCDDGNACTTGDVCDGGLCVGATPVVCNDNNACTTDTCDGGTGCVYTDNTAACNDNNVCTDDTCDPGTGCVHTDSAAACNDGNACTTGDVCGGGLCVGATPLVCNDNNACTTDTCDGGTGCVYTDNTAACNDNNACTDDACDPGTGCVYTSNTAACDDGNACTTGDVCGGGLCVGATPVVCNDNNACTTDTCDGGTGCVYTDNTAACNDNNACTDDTCDPGTGCVHTDNTAACNDGNACTTGDVCGGGLCVGATPVVCNDNNTCTVDTCDSGTGCVYTNNTATCDDGNACTTGDVCGGGLCAGATPLVCNDNNACTDDTCDPGTGCVHTDNTAACNDGNACTTGDVCGGGLCVGATPVVCNDNNTCTVDTCDPGTGCVYTDNTAACNDNNACTDDTCDPGTGCVHTSNTAACNDNNACTDDACDPGTGCVHTSNTAACDDGDACTTGDVCGGGLCAGATPVVCNDNNVCTTDTCDTVSGCVFSNNSIVCDDGNACTSGDVCGGGLCAGATPVVCNDNNACTTDTCNSGTGCVYTDNTAACDDGNVCTADTCVSETGCVHTINGVCSIAGAVRYYRDAASTSEPSTKPLGAVPIDGTGDSSPEAWTDGTGAYALGAVAGPVSVKTLAKWGSPRAADHNDAVTSLDAATIAQASVGMVTLSANQAIAGDVSGNGETSSFDAAMVAQFSVELIDHFEVAASTGSDWRFLRCDHYLSAEIQDCGLPRYDHPTMVGPVSDEFFSVLYGDVTGNWSPVLGLAASGAAAKEHAAALGDRIEAERLRARNVSAARFPAPSKGATLTLSGWDGSQIAGADQTLILSVASGDGIEALDAVLRYDPARVSIREVKTTELGAAFTSATKDSGGVLRVGLFAVEPIRGSGKLLEIVVRPLVKPAPLAPLRLAARANEGRIPLIVRARSVPRPGALPSPPSSGAKRPTE